MRWWAVEVVRVRRRVEEVEVEVVELDNIRRVSMMGDLLSFLRQQQM